jgi:hypothetical protein
LASLGKGKIMLRVIEPVEITFTVAERQGDVQPKIVQHLIAHGGRIKVNDDSTILAGFGSNLKIRLLGAMIVGVKAMPRDVVVNLSESPGQTRVSVVVRDTFGFGTRAGISDKLQKLMYDDALSLKKAFAPAA